MKTLYDKIWDSHVVVAETDAPAILYIDLHLIHEVTTPQAFTGLRKRGLKVRRTDRHLQTLIIPFRPRAGRLPVSTGWPPIRSATWPRIAPNSGDRCLIRTARNKASVH